MPHHSVQGIISSEPGDYLIRRDAYDAVETFQADLERVQAFCANHGHFFQAVPAHEQTACEAFIVGIGRWQSRLVHSH